MRRTQARAANRDNRRKEAVERNGVWAALSTADKRASLRRRRGNSAKQLARLSTDA